MKIIKVNESQKNRLFEAYDNKFSFNELSKLGDEYFLNKGGSSVQFEYCVNHLGEPTFMGSSRCVFTLSDNIILKLAYGEKFEGGMYQNMIEYERFDKTKSKLFPAIYGHDENYTYLICENVVPAKAYDFEKIFGIPFYGKYLQNSVKKPNKNGNGDAAIGFNKYFDNIKPHHEEYGGISIRSIVFYLEQKYCIGSSIYNKEIENIINNIQWFKELRNLVAETKLGDLSQVGNYGIVNRNGSLSIVILDSGMNMSVYNQFYR